MSTPQRATLAAMMAVLATALVSAGCGSDRSDSAPTSARTSSRDARPVVTTTADNLTKLYDQNEVRTDSKYKGRTMKVAAEVDQIGADVFGSNLVELVGHKAFRAVICRFDEDNQVDEVVELRVGDAVTISGVLGGMGFVSVELDGSRLVG